MPVTGNMVFVVLSQPDAYHVERAQLFHQHVTDQAEALHSVSQISSSVFMMQKK